MSARVVYLRPPVPASVDRLFVAPTPSDAELVEAARRGDRNAEESLFRRHAPHVAGLAHRLLASDDAAEDVVQETFLLAFEKLSTLRDPAAFRAWIAHIAVSRVRRRYRQRRFLRFFGLASDVGLADVAAEGASPEAIAELRLVDAALVRVPADERLAWALRYVEGMPLEEIAKAVGCSLATVKRRIDSVRAVLRAHVGDLP